MEKNERRGVSISYDGEEVTYRVWWGNMRERDDLKNPGVDGMIITK